MGMVEDVREDIENYLNKNEEYLVEKARDMGRYKFIDYMYITLFDSDNVTGDASGSYYCNNERAKKSVIENLDLLEEAAAEMCIESINILDQDWETWDVYIRRHLVNCLYYDMVQDFYNEHISEEEEED